MASSDGGVVQRVDAERASRDDRYELDGLRDSSGGRWAAADVFVKTAVGMVPNSVSTLIYSTVA